MNYLRIFLKKMRWCHSTTVLAGTNPWCWYCTSSEATFHWKKRKSVNICFNVLRAVQDCTRLLVSICIECNTSQNTCKRSATHFLDQFYSVFSPLKVASKSPRITVLWFCSLYTCKYRQKCPPSPEGVKAAYRHLHPP